MAILHHSIRPKDGIQFGGPLDYCSKCVEQKHNGLVKYGELEYKEVFKLHRNGVAHTVCMDHLKELLGDYILTKNECKCTSCNCEKETAEETMTETDKKETVVKEKTTKKKTLKKDGDK